jgi:hypothetical protein
VKFNSEFCLIITVYDLPGLYVVLHSLQQSAKESNGREVFYNINLLTFNCYRNLNYYNFKARAIYTVYWWGS